MNSIERSISALSLENYDRVSVNPEIDLSYAGKLYGVPVGECFINEELHAEALENVFKRHDVDGLYVNICLSRSVIEDIKQNNNSFEVTDTCGNTWNVPFDDVGTIVKRDIKSLNDRRLMTENPLKNGILETFSKISKNIRDKYMTTPGVTGPFSQIVFLYGLENTLFSMIDEPERLKDILEYRTVIAKEWVDELFEAGAMCVWIGEGPASSSVISPAQYIEFVFPYQKKLVEHIREKGLLCIMHMCGDINKTLKYIVETGVNGIDIDYLVDLKYAYDQVGGRACLKGNINPADLIALGENKVFEIAKQKISGFENKGLILSTGCLVGRDTPPENIDAMVNAAYELYYKQ